MKPDQMFPELLGSHDLAKLLDLPNRDMRITFSEADFYGASKLVAGHLGLPVHKLPRSSARWYHAPVPDWRDFLDPYDFYTQRSPLYPKSLRRLLVPNLRTQEYMRSCGYEAVTAAGSPILLAEEAARPRRLDSFLVMPSHVLESGSYSAQASDVAARFLNSALEIADGGFVLACLHYEDAKRQLWPDQLDKKGIPWVSGAHKWDMNSLVRMVTLMSQFQTVITNDIGSHIIYAWWLGSDVTLLDVGTTIDLSSMLSNEPWLSRHPKQREALAAEILYGDDTYASTLSSHFASTFHALSPEGRRKLASDALGIQDRLSAQEIAHLLGWVRWSGPWAAGLVTAPDRILRWSKRKVVGFRT